MGGIKRYQMDGRYAFNKNNESTFFPHPDLQEMLEDLAAKNYVKLEHPKDIVQKQDETEKSVRFGNTVRIWKKAIIL